MAGNERGQASHRPSGDSAAPHSRLLHLWVDYEDPDVTVLAERDGAPLAAPGRRPLKRCINWGGTYAK
jgi:hypothetical protein